MPARVRFDPGHTVSLAGLQRPVALAADVTPGAVCESLARMAGGERAALRPRLDDCLRPVPGDRAPDAGASEGSLVAIQLAWRCVCWGNRAIGGHPPAQVSPDFLGLRNAWPETGASPPAPETALLDRLAGLFDGFSFYSSPEARDRERAELRRED
jgi:hypothetical protein